MTASGHIAEHAGSAGTFQAVVADMDGVVTRTATLHEEAWKRLFDEYLETLAEQRPFSHDDYRAFVDGKRREAGIRDFLASRGIAIAEGTPSDPPDADTVFALGKRKNAIFLALLGPGAVPVYDDALVALRRWRRGAMKLGIFSASRNCRRVLRAAGMDARFDVVIGGERALELRLGDKSDQITETAWELGVSPRESVVLEDATSGVRAAKEAGFGWVVGIDRGGDAEDLWAAGADDVVESVARVRFPRAVPSALTHRGDIETWLAQRATAVFLDYDGTLTPIVDRPSDAYLSEETRALIEALASHCPVAVVSGRDRKDVEARVGIAGIFYAGSHGLDIAGPGHARTPEEAGAIIRDLDAAEHDLAEALTGIDGVVIERKRFTLAIHYRMVRGAADVAEVAEAVERAAARRRLRKRAGKKVLELAPAVDWHKGRAVRWVMEVLGLDARQTGIVYIGDDETDEDAFAAMSHDGVGIRVGSDIAATLSDYQLFDQREVRQFLAWLVTLNEMRRRGRPADQLAARSGG